ncbi:acyltransferase [bacterium]|nr:acyltransferase [bacterium]
MRVKAYDGLRCFLLLALLEFHYGLAAGVPMARLWPLSLALMCFFVLSGFLITRSLLEQPDVLRFWWRRAWRILPAYYVVLGLAAWIYWPPYLGWLSVYLLNFKLYDLSLSAGQEFVDLMSLGPTSGIHLWSMNVEEQFYLFYPLLFRWCPAGRRGWCLGLGLLGSIAYRQWQLVHQPHSCFGVLPWVAGEHLLWGCLAAWLDHRRKLDWLRTPVCMYASLLAFVGLLAREPQVGQYGWGLLAPPQQSGYGFCLALLVLGLAHQPGSYLAGWLTLKPFRLVGKVAYGAYLVHPYLIPPLQELVQQYPVLAVLPGVPLAVIGPVVTVAVAWAMWLSFEGPANRLKHYSGLKSSGAG